MSMFQAVDPVSISTVLPLPIGRSFHSEMSESAFHTGIGGLGFSKTMDHRTLKYVFQYSLELIRPQNNVYLIDRRVRATL